MQVVVNGTPVQDARLTALTIAVAGTHDISSTSFEGGQGIEFAADRPISLVGITPVNVAHAMSERSIVIGPQLMRRGEPISFTLVTAGPPQFRQPTAPIADVRVISENAERERVERMSDRILFGSLATLILLGALGIVIDSGTPDNFQLAGFP